MKRLVRARVLNTVIHGPAKPTNIWPNLSEFLEDAGRALIDLESEGLVILYYGLDGLILPDGRSVVLVALGKRLVSL